MLSGIYIYKVIIALLYYYYDYYESDHNYQYTYKLTSQFGLLVTKMIGEGVYNKLWWE